MEVLLSGVTVFSVLWCVAVLCYKEDIVVLCSVWSVVLCSFQSTVVLCFVGCVVLWLCIVCGALWVVTRVVWCSLMIVSVVFGTVLWILCSGVVFPTLW